MAIYPVYALNETAKDVPFPDGSQNVHFAWSLPSTINLADQMYFDVSLDPGFVSYVVHPAFPKPFTQTSFQQVFQPGNYWVRINLHYPGYGSGSLDRGWKPSNVIGVVVAGGSSPPTGIPAIGLVLNKNVLTWTLGQGVNGSVITRQAVDFSAYEAFDDILAAPFNPPGAGGVITIDQLPFAVDMPVAGHQLTIHNLPSNCYIRVNTLFSQRTWLPSQVMHVSSGFPWWALAAIGGVILLVANRSTEEE